MKRLLALVFLFLFIPCAAAQEIEEKSTEAQVDALFAEWDSLDSPGAAVAVIKDGIVIYRNGYGSAQLEYGVPISPSTIFHVASVSKQFTAMAITMLADQDKLSLDDDIHTYLPYVPDFGVEITVRHLLHHTSGLRDQWELLAMAGWRLDDVITREHILKMVRKQQELNFQPGEEYLYCNTGYTLLAEIVTEVSGTPFPEWCHENIFKPLGMTGTHFHDDHELIVRSRAYSYSGNSEEGFKNSVLSYANVGATSLFTTVEDLANWMFNFEIKKVGGDSIINQMQEKGVLNNGKEIAYAHGILVDEYRGLKTLSHSGGDAGFRSEIIYFPEQRFGVVVLSNYANANPAAKAREIADIFLGDQFPAQPEKKKPERTSVEIDPKILENYVGRYEFKDWIIVTFSLEEGTFRAELPGFGVAELFPMSDNEFFMKESDIVVTFEKAEGEKAENVTFLFGGSTERKGKRLPDITPTAAMLAEYTGEYFSEELGTTYTLVMQEDALFATHRRHDDIPLEFIKADSLLGNRWFFRKLEFSRDNDYHIDGFLLTGGRVRNLRFDKVNP